MQRYIHRSAVAACLAAALVLAPGLARAALVFTPTTFDGFNAVIDNTSGLGWVSPNIAAGDTWADLNAACHPACTGALTGLTWATHTQVDTFWTDIGIPLVPPFQNYAGIGVNLLGSLISALGPPIHTESVPLFGTTEWLGGITNDPLDPVFGLPNTSDLRHFFSVLGTGLDNEDALTFGTGNGFGQSPSTFGWLYFTPAAVPAPLIGHSLPVLVAFGGVLLGAKLLGRGRKGRQICAG